MSDETRDCATRLGKVRLGDVCTINYGTRIRSAESNSDAFPVYGGGGRTFGWGSYNREDQCVVSRFAMSPECVRYVPGKFFLNDSGLTVEASRDDVDQGYLNCFLLGHQREIYALGRGCAQKNLKIEDFKGLLISLPTLAEQKKIVGKLNYICDLIAKRKEQLVKLDQLVKSRFVEMFGGAKEPKSVELNAVSEISSGLTKNSKREKLPLRYRYLRVANVFFNKLDLTDVAEIGVEEREIAKNLLAKNDLLFVEGNGSKEQIGRVAIWDGSIEPCLHQNHLIKARFNGAVVPEYALHYFMSQDGRKQILDAVVSTSGLHTLSTGKISKFKPPLPPIQLQQEFADFITQLDKSEFAVRKSLEELQKLYRQQLQEAFG